MENLGNYSLSCKPMVITDSLSYKISKYNQEIGFRAFLVNVFQEKSLKIIDSLIIESSKKYSFMRDTIFSSDYCCKKKRKKKTIPVSTYRIFSCGESGELKYSFVITGQENTNIFFEDIENRMKSIPKDDDVWIVWGWFKSYKQDVEYYINL